MKTIVLYTRQFYVSKTSERRKLLLYLMEDNKLKNTCSKWESHTAIHQSIDTLSGHTRCITAKRAQTLPLTQTKERHMVLPLSFKMTRPTLEGSLTKWTNVMKGWQHRWFVLDENAGLLSYYTVSVSLRSVSPRKCFGHWDQGGCVQVRLSGMFSSVSL